MRHDAKALLVPPASGEPVSLAPSDIAVGAKIGANRRRQGSIVAALENLFKRK